MKTSVEVASALGAATGAWDALARVRLKLELVIVRDLLAHLNPFLGVQNDTLHAARRDDPRVAVAVAAVVGEAC
eukprot:CAMPEP_0195587162 /NCGR_PEP_ID=MMETSP0814-20130614/30500_1 /TAXON_ID=97485 /ORGANISM="Prymnesium parvum, Strain Texoma1" /LENGTH=73 /DNA_ID=CAMNT_0040725871 /DNA_START=476 /DNA_END=694 /DNA_ORIENTATION=+